MRGTLVADVFLRSGLKSYLPFPKIAAVGSLRRAIIMIIREETPFPALEKVFVLTRCFYSFVLVTRDNSFSCNLRCLLYDFIRSTRLLCREISTNAVIVAFTVRHIELESANSVRRRDRDLRYCVKYGVKLKDLLWEENCFH